ncbi:MAG: Rid family detoxifying hydrolase [Deltaproteobacteria bacterium]|jgi:2-iminobutanoate/2-iminopropanoate deaminase|nr:Rid family detoxifying hydrolase [Deltaproteobacteria bacterium]
MSNPVSVTSDKLPGAVGPYSHALVGGGFIFTSGQLPVDPATRAMPDDIKEQAALSLTNLKNVLAAGGSSLGQVMKTTVYLTDIKDFPAVNEVYATFFQQPYPARSCFAVKELPLGAKIEIEAVALA